MQSMQRKFGRLMSKGPGNNAKVSLILNDYDDADKVLAKVSTHARREHTRPPSSSSCGSH